MCSALPMKLVSGKCHHTYPLNTLRPRQNGRHFADYISMRIFLNENIWIPIKISLKFVPWGSINNIPALVQIMAWRRPGDKPLSEPMMVNLLTHICVTRSQWVNPALCHHLLSLGHNELITNYMIFRHCESKSVIYMFNIHVSETRKRLIFINGPFC